MADPNRKAVSLSAEIGNTWMELSRRIAKGELSSDEAKDKTRTIIHKVAEKIEFEAAAIAKSVHEDRLRLIDGTWPEEEEPDGQETAENREEI